MPVTDNSFPRQLLSPRYWPTWFGLGMLRLIAWMPYPLQYLAGHLLGILFWLLPLPQKKIIKTNLKLCFPESNLEERKKLLLRNCLSMGMAVVEVAMSWWSSDRQLKKLVSIDGLENLQAALEKNNGVILLSPHFTTLEISGRLLSLHRPFHVMYRDQKNAAFDYVMTRARERHYKKAIHRNDIKSLLLSLKSNMPVWYAPDQHFGGANHVMVKFFGYPVPTNPATARITKISQSPVLAFHQRRLPGLGGYHLQLEPVLENFPGDDIATDTLRVNQTLEKMIMACPDQYLWAHRRFKGPPGVKDSPYPV